MVATLKDDNHCAAFVSNIKLLVPKENSGGDDESGNDAHSGHNGTGDESGNDVTSGHHGMGDDRRLEAIILPSIKVDFQPLFPAATLNAADCFHIQDPYASCIPSGQMDWWSGPR